MDKPGAWRVMRAAMVLYPQHRARAAAGILRTKPVISVLAALFLAVLPVLSACQTSDALSSAANEATGRRTPAGPLPEFKDALFAYRKPLEVRDGGSYLVVPYDELKDINQRDEMPVRKVHSRYIRRLPASAERDFTYASGENELGVLGAGKLDAAARLTVVYLHGRDGNRKWGFDDERFGGNFNRLKNLVAAAGGAYLSPDFSGFEARGAADIAALIAARAGKIGPVILACGSLGTKICWALADDAGIRKNLAGIVVLGGFPDRNFLRAAYSGAVKPVPVYIAHGSRDPVYAVEAMEDFYNALNVKSYPVRMTVFDTGNHGTPVRMVDWRSAINWLLSAGGAG